MTGLAFSSFFQLVSWTSEEKGGGEGGGEGGGGGGGGGEGGEGRGEQGESDLQSQFNVVTHLLRQEIWLLICGNFHHQWFKTTKAKQQSASSTSPPVVQCPHCPLMLHVNVSNATHLHQHWSAKVLRVGKWHLVKRLVGGEGGGGWEINAAINAIHTCGVQTHFTFMKVSPSFQTKWWPLQSSLITIIKHWEKKFTQHESNRCVLDQMCVFRNVAHQLCICCYQLA